MLVSINASPGAIPANRDALGPQLKVDRHGSFPLIGPAADGHPAAVPPAGSACSPSRMKFFVAPLPRRQVFPRSTVVAAVLGLVCGLGCVGTLPAQDELPHRPERVGADAPHQERNPTKRPEAYLLHPAPAPVAVVDTGTVKVTVGNEAPPKAAVRKRKGRTARPARGAAAAERIVQVRKAEPVGPSPEEVAAEREARRAELRRPTRTGNDAPHQERSLDPANPEVTAGRIITIERP